MFLVTEKSMNKSLGKRPWKWIERECDGGQGQGWGTGRGVGGRRGAVGPAGPQLGLQGWLDPKAPLAASGLERREDRAGGHFRAQRGLARAQRAEGRERTIRRETRRWEG